MPAQPACFHRLDEILSALRSMTSTQLDRAAVEKLFRVRQRRARQIMADLEGPRVGNRRGGVTGGSHRASGADGGQWEGNRRARVVEDLDLARQQRSGGRRAQSLAIACETAAPAPSGSCVLPRIPGSFALPRGMHESPAWPSLVV